MVPTMNDESTESMFIAVIKACRKYEVMTTTCGVKIRLAWLPMVGWMLCDFTSFSTVFQSTQDDGRTIMKGCVQWNAVYD